MYRTKKEEIIYKELKNGKLKVTLKEIIEKSYDSNGNMIKRKVITKELDRNDELIVKEVKEQNFDYINMNIGYNQIDLKEGK